MDREYGSPFAGIGFSTCGEGTSTGPRRRLSPANSKRYPGPGRTLPL